MRFLCSCPQVWDLSSPVFIRSALNGKTLTIPTAFCSWHGEALDQKTPLLRSQQALHNNVFALIQALGECAGEARRVTRITNYSGGEQEFFLVDRNSYLSRPDLMFCGRTLIGGRPPKGQEFEDHYFGHIPPRVLAYIEDVEDVLWRLGVPLKTRHNEVAPAQFEIAPIFEAGNLATDHNMLTMVCGLRLSDCSLLLRFHFPVLVMCLPRL